MKKYTIRHASSSDAAVIAGHRVDMFCEMGDVPTEALAAELREKSTAALAVALDDGSYIGWLTVDANDRVIAGAGAHVKPQLPRISHDRTSVATMAAPLIVNVYTEPDFRRKGIARGLMKVIQDWAQARGFDRVVLHASDAGRPLYASMGFSATNEMRWSPGRRGHEGVE
jgi:GNAT superfamily N-acetyltransferase